MKKVTIIVFAISLVLLGCNSYDSENFLNDFEMTSRSSGQNSNSNILPQNKAFLTAWKYVNIKDDNYLLNLTESEANKLGISSDDYNIISLDINSVNEEFSKHSLVADYAVIETEKVDIDELEDDMIKVEIDSIMDNSNNRVIHKSYGEVTSANSYGDKHVVYLHITCPFYRTSVSLNVISTGFFNCYTCQISNIYNYVSSFGYAPYGGSCTFNFNNLTPGYQYLVRVEITGWVSPFFFYNIY